MRPTDTIGLTAKDALGNLNHLQEGPESARGYQSSLVSKWRTQKSGRWRKSGDEMRNYKIPRGTKAKLLRRDGNRCVLCDSTKNLIIHHYFERWDSETRHENYPYGLEHIIRFLVLLCRSCHGKYHANPESRLVETLHSYMEKKGVMKGSR